MFRGFFDRSKCCSKEKLKEIGKEQCTKHYVLDLLKLYIIYGVIINFTLTSLFHIEFTFYSPLAWGFLFYFIKDEFPAWIKSVYPERWRRIV